MLGYNRTSGGTWVCLVLVIAIFMVIVCGAENGEPKCAKSGCDNQPADESSYCYSHKPYLGSTSKKTYSSMTSSTTGSTKSSRISNGSSYTGNSSSRSNLSPTTSLRRSTSKKIYHDSYDDGYDAVFYDEDYDQDRYYSDSGYATGVDDAMDELNEDW